MKQSIKILVFIILAIVLEINPLYCQTVNYNESFEIIANPDRGLKKYFITSNGYSTTLGQEVLDINTLTNLRNGPDKITIVFRIFLLDAFLNSDINSIYLQNIQSDFNNIRTAGMKSIIRFSYADALDEVNNPPYQPSKSQILSHIAQIAPILNANKDIILTHQAGFIGTYGEWYYTNSTEFGHKNNISSDQWQNRKDILDELLNITPFDIPIQVRTPAIKQNLYGLTQLTDLTAYQNTPKARIGIYNDAFLNKWGDSGTFTVSDSCQNPTSTADYFYTKNETKYVPMSGESSGLNDCENGLRTSGNNAVFELNETNWSSINEYWNPLVWDEIIAANKYDDVLRNLGYRFVLDNSTVINNGNNFQLQINLTNAGYARPFRHRDVYLVLQNTEDNSTYTELINTDIRTWESQITLNQNFDLNIVGTFKLYLWLPDKDPQLQTNTDYAIQLANVGLWDSSTGYNNLNQTITLTQLSNTKFSSNSSFSISPNPSTNEITINLIYSKFEVVQFYDLHGKLIKETFITENEKIDISEMSSGVYLVKLKAQNSTVIKFIKK